VGQPVKHWQIHAKNPDRAAEFYKAAFGWNVESANALGYRMVNTNATGGVDGGIWPAPPEGTAMVSLYVEVDDVAKHAKRVTELGGKIVMPPQMLPDGDEMAVVLDPEGIPFGLMRPSAAQRKR
jgi:predicted enzyme related to lactoylglutathione lyase